MTEGDVRRTVAPTVAEVLAAHGELQLTDVFTEPYSSTLGVRLVYFIASVLERGLRTLAMSVAALGDPRAGPP